ncbi:MAG: glycoside hydrolase family 2 protein [Oliverpabstia sp.]
MRKYSLLNGDWKFIKEDKGIENLDFEEGFRVNLPHTWNAEDGQDGGNDYYRGKCWYMKELDIPMPDSNTEVWLEFRGVAMTADVYINEQKLAHHEGGYSTFRVNITDALNPVDDSSVMSVVSENRIEVSVDNSANRTVYPQKADFTFYGGIYRDVYLVTVPKVHFAMDYYGSPAIKVTPHLSENLSSAEVMVEAWISGSADGSVAFTVDGVTQSVTSEDGYAQTVFHLENVHLWDGVNDPYLYTAKAELQVSGDMVETTFGCRTFSIDAMKGFFLNGRNYPLCGAARHQDRQGIGNALTHKEHEEDLNLLMEMGANTVRLAHYQHDQYFYDLCDKAGLIVWAEIPYITEHMPEGRANTISQMTELVVQNYNHPSIICWGLSNEITATGGVSEDLIDNHRELNELCHSLDSTRPTTMAHVMMLDPNEEIVTLPDIRSYNLYYGWYVGNWDGNDQWFDEFHRAHSDTVMGLSEFGADANPTYQSAVPEQGDWSESYQAVYHEHMLEMWSKRPYIWAMHVWNMFDFGADGRDEGGKPGQNQKGLVTFDRKIKKDAFYIYKAYLSKEPFVHLCGSRYVDRTEDTTEIKVYSNQSEVTLYVDGKKFGTQTGDKIFIFHVPISGEHRIEVSSGKLKDQMVIRKAEQANLSYLKAGREVVNWFDKEELTVIEGYYSVKDTMAELKKSSEAAAVLAPIQEKATAAYGDVAQNIQIPESLQRMMDQMTVEDSLKQMGSLITPEILKDINLALNQIKKQ